MLMRVKISCAISEKQKKNKKIKLDMFAEYFYPSIWMCDKIPIKNSHNKKIRVKESYMYIL